MLFAVLIGIFALIFISVYKEDRDSTNICNKIYRKLVSRDDLEHLNIAEWVDLEKTILEKWKYASESYSKTLLGRINARKEYDEEELREDRDSEEHFVDWSNAEPRIYGSHPSLFDEETHKQWLEEWRREMQQNRFSVRFKQLLRKKMLPILTCIRTQTSTESSSQRYSQMRVTFLGRRPYSPLRSH